MTAFRVRLAGLIMLASASTSVAQTPTLRSEVSEVSDSALRAFFSEEVPRMLTRLDVPGALVVAVRHDSVLLKAGFGLADVAKKLPVESDRTVFRVASVSKIFTALAAIQLAEAGKLRLDEDVAHWVPDVNVGPRAGDTVTLHHLLTHTAGFDDPLVGYLNPAGAVPPALGGFLAAHMPARPRTSGSIPAYSNYGYALAGLIVERVAGQPLDVHFRERIFAPLGMTHTGFVLEPETRPPAGLATEYRSSGDRRRLRSSRPYPAGNLGTTGDDMSRFLLALGRALRGSPSSIISHSAALALAGPVLRYNSELPPMGYGLSGVPIGGDTVWMKGGASPSHSAVVAVIPSLDLALFIAVNRQEPLVWDGLLKLLLGRFGFAPANRSASSLPQIQVAGDYLWTRAPLGSFEKVLGLAAQIRVVGRGDSIRVSGPAEVAGAWVRHPGQPYRRSDGQALAFDDRATHAFSVVQGQPVSFERIAFYRTTRAQLVALAGATLLALLAAGVAVVRRRRDGQGRKVMWARRAIVGLPIALVVTVAGSIALASQTDALQESQTGLLRLTLGLAAATAAIALTQTAGGVALMTSAERPRAARVLYGLGAVGGLTIAWFLAANRLIL